MAAIDNIAQDDAYTNYAWSTFTLDKSEDFTEALVERLNDSILTCVWALVAAQAHTRTRILGTGTAFELQK